MRTWLYAPMDVICNGPCGRLVKQGELVLEFELAGIHRRPRRCITCAGEAPPTDVPKREVLKPPPLEVSRLGLLALDYSNRLVGDREPGEEG